nr:MAG TPA: regulatory protein [Caudoviricetes sp.]
MNQIEQTITSVEVSEMVEKTHANLLKDIRRYYKHESNRTNNYKC